MTNQFYYDSDPQCGGGIETNAVPVSVLQTMRHLFDDEPVLFKHLDPHAAVFHNTKCSLAVPVSVILELWQFQYSYDEPILLRFGSTMRLWY
jgi:hypothetical protein